MENDEASTEAVLTSVNWFELAATIGIENPTARPLRS